MSGSYHYPFCFLQPARSDTTTRPLVFMVKMRKWYQSISKIPSSLTEDRRIDDQTSTFVNNISVLTKRTEVASAIPKPFEYLPPKASAFRLSTLPSGSSGRVPPAELGVGLVGAS